MIYDIGANVGSYTLLASRLVGSAGRVIAFEPLSENVAYLRRHLEINGSRNVEVWDVAVVEHTGRVRFNAAPDRLIGQVRPEGTLEVEGISLDDAVARSGIVPTYVKIDVEGGEGAVLRGGQQLFSSSRPTVFVSTHGAGPNEECLAFLRDAHYVTRTVRGSPDELVAVPAGSVASWMNSTDLVPCA